MDFDCERCGMQLPLRPPHGGEEAPLWRCRNCDEIAVGVFDFEARDSILNNVIEVPESVSPQ